MTDRLPANLDVDAPLFTVSVAARLADMHPQTLRGYDRLGLVVPVRNKGRGRRYSLRDVATLRHIQHLSQEEGINLEGIRRILALEADLDAAHEQIERLFDLLESQRQTLAPRTFTVGQGTVHVGRGTRPAPRALTPGR